MYDFLPWDTPCLTGGHIFFLIWRLFNHKSIYLSYFGLLLLLAFLEYFYKNGETSSMSFMNGPAPNLHFTFIRFFQKLNKWIDFFSKWRNVIYGWPPCHLWMPPFIEYYRSLRFFLLLKILCSKILSYKKA